MFDLVASTFAGSGLLPHGQCFLWIRELLLLHVASDALIALAYYSIPLALIYFVHRRVEVEFRGVFVMFAVFILACGTTHLLDVWTVWHPDYWLHGAMKAFTAAVSVTTAVLVWFLMPMAMALPSPRQLRLANEELRREMSERRRALGALTESEQRFRSAFDFAPIGMALVSPEGRWLKVNQALCEIVGYTEAELLSTDFQLITHTDDLEADLALVRELLEGRRQSYQMEKRYIHKRGDTVWILLAVSLVHDLDGGPLYFVAQIQDITERKRAAEALQKAHQELETRVEERTRALAEANVELAETNRQLERMARYDELTGLCNRRHLMDLLEQAFRTARRYGKPLCVMMLDADHFKRINDTYGHLIGDRVLGVLGRLLKSNLRASDITGRYGGEEFCVALPETDLVQTEATAEKLRRLIEAEAIPDDQGGTFNVTCSIGIAALEPDLTELTVLLDRADEALYAAKRAGRNRVMVAEESSEAPA